MLVKPPEGWSAKLSRGPRLLYRLLTIFWEDRSVGRLPDHRASNAQPRPPPTAGAFSLQPTGGR